MNLIIIVKYTNEPPYLPLEAQRLGMKPPSIKNFKKSVYVNLTILKAQLFTNYIYVTDSLRHTFTQSWDI